VVRRLKDLPDHFNEPPPVVPARLIAVSFNDLLGGIVDLTAALNIHPTAAFPD